MSPLRESGREPDLCLLEFKSISEHQELCLVFFWRFWSRRMCWLNPGERDKIRPCHREFKKNMEETSNLFPVSWAIRRCSRGPPCLTQYKGIQSRERKLPRVTWKLSSYGGRMWTKGRIKGRHGCLLCHIFREVPYPPRWNYTVQKIAQSYEETTTSSVTTNSNRVMHFLWVAVLPHLQ